MTADQPRADATEGGYWRFDSRCETTPKDHERGDACDPLMPHSHRGDTVKWARWVADQPRADAIAAIHADRDGCNGRPHRRWYRGENKCEHLAHLAALAPADPTADLRAAIAFALDYIDWDASDMAEVQHHRAALAASTTEGGS